MPIRLEKVSSDERSKQSLKWEVLLLLRDVILGNGSLDFFLFKYDELRKLNLF